MAKRGLRARRWQLEPLKTMNNASSHMSVNTPNACSHDNTGAVVFLWVIGLSGECAAGAISNRGVGGKARIDSVETAKKPLSACVVSSNSDDFHRMFERQELNRRICGARPTPTRDKGLTSVSMADAASVLIRSSHRRYSPQHGAAQSQVGSGTTEAIHI